MNVEVEMVGVAAIRPHCMCSGSLWPCGLQATSFNEVRGKPGGHELTARINILPIRSPDPSLESHVQEIEDKRSKDERNMFRQVGKLVSTRRCP